MSLHCLGKIRKFRLINKKGTSFPRYPFRSEQPHERGYHRDQSRGHIAPYANPVDRTVRLAGFEHKDHHQVFSIFVRGLPYSADATRKPAVGSFVSCIRPWGCLPNTASAVPCLGQNKYDSSIFKPNVVGNLARIAPLMPEFMGRWISFSSGGVCCRWNWLRRRDLNPRPSCPY